MDVIVSWLFVNRLGLLQEGEARFLHVLCLHGLCYLSTQAASFHPLPCVAFLAEIPVLACRKDLEIPLKIHCCPYTLIRRV